MNLHYDRSSEYVADLHNYFDIILKFDTKAYA